MRFSILLISFLLCSSAGAQGLIDSLNNILSDLPPGDRGKFVATYKTKFNPKDEVITIIETRHSADMSITDSVQGHYVVHLNDLDPGKLAVQDMPNQQFRIYLPCVDKLPKSNLYVRSKTSIHGEYVGTNVSMGFWKDASSRELCQQFIDILADWIRKAKPKPISISSFNERTEFKVSAQINFLFDEASKQYKEKDSNNNLRKIIFQHQQMFVIYGGKTEATYQTESIGLEENSDRIQFDVKDNDIKVILVSPNGDHITLISEDRKTVYETDPILKTK